MKLLFRTDCHVSDRSPASWKGDYQAEVWDLLTQVGELAEKHNVDAVIDGGDYFHVKAATRNSHALVARTAALHGNYHCPVYHVEGNHDLAHNNLDTVDKQPIGVLYESGVFKQLRDVTFEGPDKTRVVGFPYAPNRTLDELRAVRKEGDERLIAVVHQLAAKAPPGRVEEFFGEPVFKYEDLIYDDGPDVWCFGHWHIDQGIEVLDGRYFVNVGALSRGALVKENLTRRPKVVIIETGPTGIEAVEAVPLRVLDATEVFDLEKKERQEKRHEAIEAFARTLRHQQELDTSASLEDTIGSLAVSQEVSALMLEYLERARVARSK